MWSWLVCCGRSWLWAPCLCWVLHSAFLFSEEAVSPTWHNLTASHGGQHDSRWPLPGVTTQSLKRPLGPPGQHGPGICKLEMVCFSDLTEKSSQPPCCLGHWQARHSLLWDRALWGPCSPRWQPDSPPCHARSGIHWQMWQHCLCSKCFVMSLCQSTRHWAVPLCHRQWQMLCVVGSKAKQTSNRSSQWTTVGVGFKQWVLHVFHHTGQHILWSPSERWDTCSVQTWQWLWWHAWVPWKSHLDSMSAVPSMLPWGAWWSGPQALFSRWSTMPGATPCEPVRQAVFHQPCQRASSWASPESHLYPCVSTCTWGAWWWNAGQGQHIASGWCQACICEMVSWICHWCNVHMSHDTLAEHAWRESDIAYCLPGSGKLSLCNTSLSALSMSEVAPWKYISTAADNALMSPLWEHGRATSWQTHSMGRFKLSTYVCQPVSRSHGLTRQWSLGACTMHSSSSSSSLNRANPAWLGSAGMSCSCEMTSQNTCRFPFPFLFHH